MLRKLAFVLVLLTVTAHAATLRTAHITATVAPNGDYSVTVAPYGWQFAGSLNAPATAITQSSGADKLGPYRQLQFHYTSHGTRLAAIRLYTAQPAVQFTMQMLSSGDNAAAFPAFTTWPTALHHAGFDNRPFAPIDFSTLGPQGPWLFFDVAAHAAILSPLDHFYVTSLTQPAGSLTLGITSSITTLPAGFTHSNLLVVSTGINTAFDVWGHALQTLASRHTPSNESDILLQKLSYWTDNGAAYYYTFDPALGYEGTLLKIRDHYRASGVDIGSLQLDSWFYPKGAEADWQKHKKAGGGWGYYVYEPDPRIFPKGLPAFEDQLGLPLITHSRWVDESSPYQKQYKISGNVIIDPAFWQTTAQWLHESNVQVYEQDWLGTQARAAENLTDPELYHDQMAAAMQHQHITMQYCMPAPADYLQGTRYSNLTTIRTASDRFERPKWDYFLFSSRLASALGIWPFTDLIFSGETDNLVLATLSAGPVGVGEDVTDTLARNLLLAARADGVIVKPDVPARPLDSMYQAQLSGKLGTMVASSWTNHGPLRTTYVFAYAQVNQSEHANLNDITAVSPDTHATVTPANLGYSNPVYFYDWRSRTGQLVAAHDAFTLPFTDGWGYAVAAPVQSSGLALIGDTAQIATAGKQRISTVKLLPSGLQLTVLFAPGESPRTIVFYSEHPPHTTGQILSRTYDAATHLFRVTVAPGPGNQATFSVLHERH